jgi:hypothetical protein
MRITLEFDPEHGRVHRARLQYAFALFCAIYGHEAVSAEASPPPDARLTYVPASDDARSGRTLRLGRLYDARPVGLPAPPPSRFERASRSTFLIHRPVDGSEPDWLGEIFEWVSCADEYSVQARDSAGRVEFASSYCGRHTIDVRVPYAAVAMAFLHDALCACAFGHPVDPEGGVRGGAHFVVNTHDVDILPAGYPRDLYRLGKYALISLLVFKSAKQAVRQAGRAFAAVGSHTPLDQVPALVETQRRKGVGASYFFIAGHAHRRDGNYRIQQPSVKALMRSIDRQGMEVAVHGSYTSLDRHDGLASEFDSMSAAGIQSYGNRQHWLRFTLDRLIPAVERAGALYDSSLGWDSPGFRAGACFAFPPYHFAEERPATFLEIPLVVMEQGLVTGGLPEADWFDEAAGVLATSRRFGRGGISLLWHPTAFGGAQLSHEIEHIYWKLVERRHDWNDAWVSAVDFVRFAAERYIDAGLLPPGYGSSIGDPGRRTISESVAAAI